MRGVNLVTSEIKAFIGRSSLPYRVEVVRREIQKYAIATGQRAERYLSGDEAPPMFVFGLFEELVGLEGLLSDGRQPASRLQPELPLKRVMAGGAKLKLFRPIRAGDVLVSIKTIKQVYEKQGSHGPIIFMTVENKVHTDKGELVLVEELLEISR